MPRDDRYDDSDDGYDAPPPRSRRRDDDRPWAPPRRRDVDDDYDDDRRVEPHRGSTVLILGLVSLLACGLIGPVAWSMGGTDLKKMRAGTMDPRGEGETKAGYVCGIIATIFLGITVIMIGVWLVFVFAVVAAAPFPAPAN